MRLNERDAPEVLIIEDDAGTRAMLLEALAFAGFEVRAAEDAVEGLDKLRSRAPSLILLDQCLPGASGLDFCRQVRREPGFGAIPLVMLTALKRPCDQVAGFEAGADDYITKPFNFDELVARLHGHVRRSRRERQLNPLTGLPGNLAIDQAIEARLARDEDFAIGWIDLDNFKVYNDRYGFFAGDNVIERTGRVMCEVVDVIDPIQSFAGHVGGDDFVIVVPSAEAERAGREIVARFDAMVPEFYAASDLERGHIVAVSRQGEQRRFPLMSISVALVPCPPGRFNHLGEIAHVATEIKHLVKQREGSAWFVDRRIGERPGPPTAPIRDSRAAVSHNADEESPYESEETLAV